MCSSWQILGQVSPGGNALIFLNDCRRCGLSSYGRTFDILLPLGLLFLLQLSLVLVLKHDLFLVGVVAGDSLNFGIRRHLQLVLSVCIKEFSLLLKHLLDRLTDIVIELLDQGVLLAILVHLFLNKAESAVDDLLV